MSVYYNKEPQAGQGYDRDLLIEELIKYYETDDLDAIGLKLKADLISAPKLRKLLEATKFSKEALIIHINTIFDGLFSNSIIRKIRNEMKKV